MMGNPEEEIANRRLRPEPKAWVRRLVKAQQVVLEETVLAWWSVHLEEFLRYCRRRGDRTEVRVLARAYFDALRSSEPPAAMLRVEQTKQALTVFIRGTENWHWERSETDGWLPRFRIRNEPPALGRSHSSPVASVPSATDRHDWERALRTALRVRHYAIRTEQTYAHWTREFLDFHPAVCLPDLDTIHVQRYLEHLAVGRNVGATTQNQALSALLFFFRHVLGRDLGDLGDTVRAKTRRKLPAVLSRDEVRRLLACTDGTTGLMLRLLYGCGLRLMECARLRVKDVDLDRSLLTVRDGKGGKDRTVPLPRSLRAELEQHRERLRRLHDDDRQRGLPGVWLRTLSVKYPRAGEELAWQWFFPGKSLGCDPRSGTRRRHHVHDNMLHLAMKTALRAARIEKQASCHTLRHYVERRTMLSRRHTPLCGRKIDADIVAGIQTDTGWRWSCSKPASPAPSSLCGCGARISRDHSNLPQRQPSIEREGAGRKHSRASGVGPRVASRTTNFRRSFDSCNYAEPAR